MKEKQSFSEASGSDPEDKRQILQARARVLAQEPGKPAEAKDYLEVLEFSLAKEQYALEISFIREVYPIKELTPLPGLPRFVLGIVNVRGQILSVVDLKKFFNLAEKGLSDLNKVIILRRGRLEVGLLADAVAGVRRVPRAAVQTTGPTLEGTSPDYLKGITREALIILDGKKILADPKLIVHEEVDLQAK